MSRLSWLEEVYELSLRTEGAYESSFFSALFLRLNLLGTKIGWAWSYYLGAYVIPSVKGSFLSFMLEGSLKIYLFYTFSYWLFVTIWFLTMLFWERSSSLFFFLPNFIILGAKLIFKGSYAFYFWSFNGGLTTEGWVFFCSITKKGVTGRLFYVFY